ncbi:MAG: PAS domain S-box protein [Anaerolineaceae bacterium]|nr:PAS domain S-box protein [Anaerolineaceae bacterium]
MSSNNLSALKAEIEKLRAENEAFRGNQTGLANDLFSSYEKFNLLLDNAPLGIIEWNENLRIVSFSKGAEQIFGWQADEIVGKRWDEWGHIHPDDLGKVGEIATRTHQQDVSQVIVKNRNIRKNGAVIWCEWSDSSLHDKNGKITRVLSIVKEITDKVEAENQLLESEEKYRAFIEGPNQPIFTVNHEGRFEFINQFGARQLGHLPEEIVGKHMLDLFPKEYADNQVAFIQSVILSNQPMKVESPSMVAGEIRWYEASLTPLVNLENEIKSVLCILVDITDRKKAQIAFEESQTRFNLFMDSSPLNAYIKDTDLRYIYANKALLESYALKSDQYISTQFSDHFDADTAQMIDLADRQIINGDKTFVDIEYKGIRQGQEVWLRDIKFPIKDGERVLGVGGLALDITDQIIAQQQLKESEERYRMLFEDSINTKTIIDLKGNYLEVNDAFCHFMEISREDLLGKNVSDFFPENDDNILGDHQPLWKTGGSLETSYQINDKAKFLYLTMTPGVWHDQEVVFGVGVDITKRKEDEQAKKESEERFRLAMEATREGLWDWHVPSGNVYYSPAWEEILGLSFVNPEFSIWEERIHPDDKDQTLITLQNHLSGDSEHWECEHRLKLDDGTYKWVLGTGRVVRRDEKGQPIQMIGTLQDIDNRKKIEETLLASEKMAGVGMLAAGVAHEINSPLQVITGLSRRMLRKLDKKDLDIPRMKHDLENLEKNSWRVANIVRSLLSYSHISLDMVQKNNLNEIIKDTLVLTEHQFSSWSNIQLKTDLQENLPDLTCERNSLIQVLINLINNGRDAMPKGGEICLRTRFDVDEKVFLLEVSDTGEGIVDKDIKHIFDPFFTTKKLGEGTGIGLSISKEIVESHGGTIGVKSFIHQGTTFSIQLPEDSPKDIKIS